ncbi:DUF1289 domain-containing protein [Magnetovibrio sp. PR-2]|uniref:DUF1289 domain-containing protein n=1 Tax=Magnetovibrio sp. PR-2 TaxID=3120356 RepID=UPI002FCE672C
MSHTPPKEPIASPCIGMCTLNDQDICIGCCRTLNEIKAWGDADDSARRAILERVSKRPP